VTDAGVSALGRGCGQLECINLTGCIQVTDAGVSALGRVCRQLRSIDLRGCPQVHQNWVVNVVSSTETVLQAVGMRQTLEYQMQHGFSVGGKASVSR
jgi:hypothetical protein